VNAANATTFGRPRLHLRRTDSTNERARALAIAGAPHGTLITASEQTAGRGRQGRSWVAPAGRALLCSLVLRDPPALLSLIAGVAVCDALGAQARVKWPNDVVIEVRDDPYRPRAQAGMRGEGPSRAGSAPGTTLAKLAGILVEGRPQEDWAVLGIGVNVAVRTEDLPAELHGRAASLELAPCAIETTLGRVVEALRSRLDAPAETVLDAWRARDALRGRELSWDARKAEDPAGRGWADGIDDAGRLIVTLADGSRTLLDAGEVHLRPTA
jgi:BirA family biotin operon repressor/biotin-[acetyl-CoA-carboxylase] ligase